MMQRVNIIDVDKSLLIYVSYEKICFPTNCSHILNTKKPGTSSRQAFLYAFLFQCTKHIHTINLACH